MAVTDLTTEQLRTMRDYLPSLSDRTPGFDLAAQIQAMIDEHQALQSALGDLGASDSTVDVTFDSVPTTAKIMAGLSTPGGNTTHVLSAVRQSATTVRVTVNAAPGGSDSAQVSVFLDLR